jgi:hypothetical protein
LWGRIQGEDKALRIAARGEKKALVAARRPRTDLGRLALTDEGGEILRERNHLCQCGIFGQLLQVVEFFIRGLL